MKILRLFGIGVFSLYSSFSSQAQKVETLAGPSPRFNNGIVVHPNGKVFASDLFGSGFNGTRIYKLNPNDGSSSLYGSGFNRPAGLVFDTNGLLYVAEFSGGRIKTVDSLGNVQTFALGLSQPSDLVFDARGNLYVTNYGNGTISKINSSGTVSLFASGFNQPVGLAIDQSGNLYSANLADGKIYKIDSLGNDSLLATVNDLPIGFMTLAKGDLYVTSTGGHRIYRVSLAGTVTPFAGTGIAGTVNGDISTAQFTNPDGIAASPGGDTLYISENNTNLMRRIILDSTKNIGFEEFIPNSNRPTHLEVFPNPIKGMTHFSYNLAQSTDVSLQIISVDGKYSQTLFSSHQKMGKHRFETDLKGLSSGAYYCKLKTGDFELSTKLVVE